MQFMTKLLLKNNIHGLGSFLSYPFVRQTQYVYFLFVIHGHNFCQNMI